MNTSNINPQNDAHSFTPGPWDIYHDFIRSSDKVVIARAPVIGGPSYQFWKKNKKLIAAAPDLIEALQLAMHALVNANSDTHAAAMYAANKAFKKVYDDDK
jgi:hypothetical protein